MAIQCPRSGDTARTASAKPMMRCRKWLQFGGQRLQLLQVVLQPFHLHVQHPVVVAIGLTHASAAASILWTVDHSG